MADPTDDPAEADTQPPMPRRTPTFDTSDVVSGEILVPPVPSTPAVIPGPREPAPLPPAPTEEIP